MLGLEFPFKWRALAMGALLLVSAACSKTPLFSEPVLHPQAQSLIDQISAAGPAPEIIDDVEWVTASRAAYLALIPMAGNVVELYRVEDRAIPGPAGPIPIRTYIPVTQKKQMPIVVFFHGGGFTSGDLDTHDRPLRQLSDAAEAIIVSVDYRLAPEHKFPAPVDDGVAAISWIFENAKPLGGDPNSIIVMGDSAGGNIATGVARRVGSEGVIKLKKQILIYPNTDLTNGRTHDSINAFDGLIINRKDMDRNISLYIPNARQRELPEASPLLAPSHSNLPPTLIITAGADPLRDEGRDFADVLTEAGVPTQHLEYPGMLHGFFQMGGVLDDGNDLIFTLAIEMNQTEDR